MLAAYEQSIHDAAASVVTILNGYVPIALGTAVGPELIVTKASELPPEPSCRLPNGAVVTPRIIGVDLSFDVALLQVQPNSDLRPVVWPDKCDPPLGTLLAAVGPDGKALAAGIVSVKRRDLSVTPSKDKLPLRVQRQSETPTGRCPGPCLYFATLRNAEKPRKQCAAARSGSARRNR